MRFWKTPELRSYGRPVLLLKNIREAIGHPAFAPVLHRPVGNIDLLPERDLLAELVAVSVVPVVVVVVADKLYLVSLTDRDQGLRLGVRFSSL